MRTSILFIPLLWISACGASSDPDIHLSLSQALSAEVTTIHLASLDGSHTCVDLLADRPAFRRYGLCLKDNFTATPPCVISRAILEVASLDLDSAVGLYVPAGSRTLAAQGFDASDLPVAFACLGPIDIAAGKKTKIELELQ